MTLEACTLDSRLRGNPELIPRLIEQLPSSRLEFLNYGILEGSTLLELEPLNETTIEAVLKKITLQEGSITPMLQHSNTPLRVILHRAN